MASIGSAQRRIRVPLALVVSRYFLYVLVGALLAVGIPAGVFGWQMSSGAVLAANYGEVHLGEVKDALAGQASFDADAIPSAYRYARFDAGGSLLASDMSGARLKAVGAVAISSGDEDSRGVGAGSSSFCAAVGLADGGRCVLCYDIVPQWADKGTRDALPNPQDLLIWTVLISMVLVIALVALRAGRVLTRRMSPLVRAAQSVGRQDLDASVGSSDVAEIDDVLRAMEEMRASLKESIEAQREAERRSREQVAALTHDLKTPLTVALGNAELLAEDTVSGGLDADQAACARAIRDAALCMDAFVSRIVEASSGQVDGMDFGPSPTDLSALTDRLKGATERLVSARGIALKTSYGPTFLESCRASKEGKAPLPLWDADALERAVLNLAGNACDHADGGPVAISFSCDAVAQEFSVAVEDEGVGFSSDALAHGTERFFRGDASRANVDGAAVGAHFGLGLSIAADIAAAHGGRLELTNRTDGAGNVLGACATMTLPLTRPSA